MRAIYMGIAAVCYAAFFAAFVYLIGFVSGYPALPSTVDANQLNDLALSSAGAAAVNVALIALFGLQHSIMARPGFKARWTRIVPPPIERSVFCLATALVLLALYVFWQPLNAVVWNIENPAARTAIWVVFAIGWAIVFLSTWLLNHFELFGLAQAWRYIRNAPIPEARLAEPLFYRFVRHPLYSGFLLAFWSAPTMTVGHLLFAVGMTIYVLIAVPHEERDLVSHFGPEYENYRERVGMLVPGIGRRRATGA